MRLIDQASISATAYNTTQIDQSVAETSDYGSIYDYVGQSFQPSRDNIIQIELYLYNTLESEDFNFYLATDFNGTEPSGGYLLAHETFTSSDYPATYSYFRLRWTLPSVIPLTINQTYWIVFESGGSIYGCMNTSNPYPRGQIYEYPAGDYVFRTYYDITVPESPLQIVAPVICAGVILLAKRKRSLM